MKNKNKITIVVVVSILSALPAFSGSWLNECVSSMKDKWNRDTAFNNGNSNDPVCPVPNDFYNADYSGVTPTQCTGVRTRGGYCRTETWGWNCEKGKLNGMGTQVDIRSACREATRADGTPIKYYFPCQVIEEVGAYRQIRVECNPK
jgi:hypothetical protein